MKDLVKKLRKKAGFTLAELLIVVAIIAVLVAIAIPVFTSQLEKSRISVDEANCRSAYGEAMATYLTTAGDASPTTTSTLEVGDNTYTWVMDESNDVMTISGGSGTNKSTQYAGGITYDGTNFTAGQ